MQVTETKNEGLSREYTLAITATDFEAIVTDRLEEIAKTIQIPGFRIGKVPVSLVRKKHGQGVMGEALDQAVNEAATKVLADNELRPAMQPKLEIVKFEEGQDIELTMAVEVMPVIELGDFSKLKVERQVVEPDEAQVDTTLERMAESYKTTTPVTKKRKSKTGDTLVIDFSGSVDGELFPGGQAEDYALELGSNSFIPGFEDQLIGTKVGDELDVKVTFPAEYGAEDLAGKDAVFACKVKELQESKPSDIDDELAKKAGFDNLDALRAGVREQHNQGFNEISRQKAKRSLLDALDEAYVYDLPAGLIEAEYESIIKASDEAVKAGQEIEDQSDEEREADYRSIAVRRVKLGLLFAEVGKNNDIQVGQDDLQAAILKEAQNYPGQEQMVFKYYQENPEAMQNLSGPVYEEKIVDFILELANVKNITVTVEELMADDEDDQPKKKAAKKKAPAKKAPAKKAAAKKAAPAKKAPAKKAPAKKAAAKKAPAKKAAAKKAD